MAKNECISKGGGCEHQLAESAAAYYGATLDSGEPVEFSEFTGVALIDFPVAGTGVMSNCAGFELTVTGQDDGGNVAVAIGDPLYFHDTTGVVDKAVNGGQFIGWARAIVSSGASTLICVILAQDPDYTRFMDEQLLEFGDGAAGKGGAGDFQMWFQLSDQDMYMDNVLAGSRLYIDTTDTGQIRLQDHLYTHTAGEQTPVRIGGRLSVTGTAAIQSLNVVPSIDEAVAASYLIGINTDVYLRGASGNISGVIRGVQSGITDTNQAGRVVTGAIMNFRSFIQLSCTANGGVYVMYCDAAGASTAYTAFLRVPDDGGALGDAASAVSATVIGVTTAEVDGLAVGYIPIYDGYTPA